MAPKKGGEAKKEPATKKEPPAKRAKKAAAGVPPGTKVIVQFVGPDGKEVADNLEVPVESTRAQLEDLLAQLRDDEEKCPYSLHVGAAQVEITETLGETFPLLTAAEKSAERILPIAFFPMSVFRVRPVTRCSSSMPGHTEAVLCAAFSPDSSYLATGSGDTTVRLWDLNTEMPWKELKGHKSWVLAVAWSADGAYLASVGMDKAVLVWTPGKGTLAARLTGHTQPVCSAAWQPLHVSTKPWLATGAKDSSIRLWDVRSGGCLKVLSSHTGPVMVLRWGGGSGEHKSGVLYSGSRDRVVKVWDPEDGRLLQDLKGHAHWVNSLALNTDDVIRTGAFEHPYFDDGPVPTTAEGRQARALERYKKRIETVGGEKLLSGSDDFTLFLWSPLVSRKPVARMTGHQQPIPFVCFSPDGRHIASCSFDKSIRIWDGRTGHYLGVLRGHVGPVYMCAWSADSRLLATGSKDSTIKLWDVAKRKLCGDLPGHADEVFCIDWSRDGSKVASGSKDRLVKIWRH